MCARVLGGEEEVCVCVGGCDGVLVHWRRRNFVLEPFVIKCAQEKEGFDSSCSMRCVCVCVCVRARARVSATL